MGRPLELLCLYFFACEQRYMRSATPTLSPLKRVIPPYRSHLQTKVLQSADKICILSFLSHLIPVSAAPLSAVCYNLYLQYGICRLALSLCSAPLCRVLQSVFAIWDLQTPPLSPSLR